ncbi:MAG: hypothetical protein D6681_11955 [Calditrichaeota bacterium]|nr:MAG: hypothetical protein D6681_11955 [Calditrichota bacterium]
MKSRVPVFILIAVLCIAGNGHSQNSTSREALLQQAQELIRAGRYTAAHALLDSALRTTGPHPDVICDLVENVLRHFVLQHDYRVFYLADSEAFRRYQSNENNNHLRLVAFRYPDRWLKKVIRWNPQYGRAYKLLGDYYFLPYRDPAMPDPRIADIPPEIREEIFQNYRKAVELQYSTPEVNLWLGKYYLVEDQRDVARQYFQQNVYGGAEDPFSYYYLAEICFADKKYTQTYNYALKALQQYGQLGLDLRYEATRLAALALYYLGEETQFLEYIRDCIRLFPDRQYAYLDLLNYYQAKGFLSDMEATMREMLLNNPYDQEGYRFLETYSVQYKDFVFGEKLFEEMLVRFEHSDEALANIYRYRGNLLFHQGFVQEARKYWEISRSYYRKFLPPDDPLLREVGSMDAGSAQSSNEQ